MNLESLSNELIQEIISHVPHPPTSLSLCTKRLHDLTAPILYASVTLEHRTSYPSFVRTIAGQPELVRYARHFQTSAHPAGWDFDLSFLRDRTLIRRALPSICGETICDNWFREIFAFTPHDNMSLATSWDAITALLLCLLSPGLRSIDISFLVSKYPRIDMVLEQACREQSEPGSMNLGLLSNLESISLKDNGPHFNYTALYRQRGLSIRFIIPYLQIKSVGRLRLSNLCNKHSATFSFPSLVLRNTDVAFIDSSLSPESVMQFLPSFCSLRQFEYRHGKTTQGSQPSFISSSIRKGLVSSMNTLEKLVVSDHRYEPTQHWKDINDDVIGPLHNFSRLRYETSFLNLE
jgi:hypothetical protein